jgi:hypothetical protein
VLAESTVLVFMCTHYRRRFSKVVAVSDADLDHMSLNVAFVGIAGAFAA